MNRACDEMIVLPTAYFGPISYYAALYQAPEVVIDAHEHYVKQSIRNRCIIGTNQGPQSLSYSVQKGNRPHQPITSVMLSDHGNWMHQHLYSLATYYGNSPFYEYYIDELREVMTKGHDGTLFGFNEALRRKICELIGFEPNLRYSEQWMGSPDRDIVEGTAVDHTPYYQVARVGSDMDFMPNLSILDLLFNLGNESILYLDKWNRN